MAKSKDNQGQALENSLIMNQTIKSKNSPTKDSEKPKQQEPKQEENTKKESSPEKPIKNGLKEAKVAVQNAQHNTPKVTHNAKILSNYASSLIFNKITQQKRDTKTTESADQVKKTQ